MKNIFNNINFKNIIFINVNTINIIYKNYIYFIKDFCIENNSEKCRITINNFLEKLGLCKNQHKKNIIKHIRWKP